jgi:hypothetical protein
MVIWWFVLGFVVVASLIAAAVVTTDGRDALAERTAALPILLAGLALAPVWPVFAALAALSWAIEQIRRRRAPSSKRSNQSIHSGMS